MPTEIDPAGVEAGLVLRAANFRDAHVLEVGAGDGRLTFRYSTAARLVVGIDTKAAEIRSAAKTAHESVRFLCASATALPFPGAKFDIVLLASSL
jgi:ubiquinone/menaquinone biosynthesis C-methylase UbiE